jgi:holo-[acyl-carrier protein] synthase
MNRYTAEVKGIGIDIVPILQIAQLIQRYDRHTLTLLFTPGEIDRCQASPDPDRSFAVCFAAKEAVGKALGIGLVGIDWNEIDTTFTQEQLTIHLSGKASAQAERTGIQRWLATWCDWDEHVMAHILAL